MSDTFRKAMMNKLPSLPPTRAPWADQPPLEDSEELEEEEDGDSLGDLGQALPLSLPPTKYGGTDLSPLSASGFFAQALEVQPEHSPNTYRVYLTPLNAASSSSSGPSSSSSRQGQGQGQAKQTYLLCHHGAGSSALSFAHLAKEITAKSGGEMGVLAFDCRGHGKTRTAGPKSAEQDLSSRALLDDLVGLVQHMFPEPKTAPAFVLLGHSMGASPILNAAPVLQQKGYSIPGIVVLDVVEGTAVEALPLMKSILSSRPTSFKSIIDGIHWHLSSNSVRNVTSARVSVPAIIVPAPPPPSAPTPTPMPPLFNASATAGSSSAKTATGAGEGEKQVWRTDLLATEPYWAEWYEGLSAKFLSAKCARLLVLAGQERLDKELMVGQMQGKFQLEVMPDTGHYLHEDDPASLASTLVTFWRRNTRVLVLPPKIGASAVQSGGVEVKRVGEE